MRRRVITAMAVAGLILASAVATVFWYEGDREVSILCGLMTAGTPREEVARILGTAEWLELRPAEVELATATAFTFDARVNLRSTRCAVSLDQAVATGSTLTRTFRLERLAAGTGAALFLFLFAFQVGLATGRVSGRLAWGGRHETLPPELRRASAATALVVPLLGWVLLERAEVVDLVAVDSVVGVGAWAVMALFLLSSAGNLASASPSERRLGIPLTAALAILGFIVAYSG